VAKYNSTDLTFEVDKSDGGALTSGLTAYITKFGDVVVDRGTIDASVFGTEAAVFLSGIVKRYDAVVIGGMYDDGAEPAPDAVFNIGKVTHSQTRTFLLTLGGSSTVGGELWITQYKRTFSMSDYHGWEATLQFTGTIAEA
jgi:hypothetical protein